MKASPFRAGRKSDPKLILLKIYYKNMAVKRFESKEEVKKEVEDIFKTLVNKISYNVYRRPRSYLDDTHHRQNFIILNLLGSLLYYFADEHLKLEPEKERMRILNKISIFYAGLESYVKNFIFGSIIDEYVSRASREIYEYFNELESIIEENIILGDYAFNLEILEYIRRITKSFIDLYVSINDKKVFFDEVDNIIDELAKKIEETFFEI
jgi:hypothetical protein